MENLAGRVAVVTGAGSGIGEGMCHAFAAAGVKVAVADIDATAADSVATAIRDGGGSAIPVTADVSRRGDIETLAGRALEELGGVDIVCNNAGVLVGGPMLETTQDDWQWLLSVNLMGVVHGSHVFAPILIERGGGHIVNTASVGGFLSFPNLATYCTSKFAVVGFSQALRIELAPHGVGVSILCPGKVRSSLDQADKLRPTRFADAGGTSRELGDLSDGMDPAEVGEHVVRGIRSDAAYIFTHAKFRSIFEASFQTILDGFDPAESESS